MAQIHSHAHKHRTIETRCVKVRTWKGITLKLFANVFIRIMFHAHKSWVTTMYKSFYEFYISIAVSFLIKHWTNGHSESVNRIENMVSKVSRQHDYDACAYLCLPVWNNQYLLECSANVRPKYLLLKTLNPKIKYLKFPKYTQNMNKFRNSLRALLLIESISTINGTSHGWMLKSSKCNKIFSFWKIFKIAMIEFQWRFFCCCCNKTKFCLQNRGIFAGNCVKIQFQFLSVDRMQ